MTKAVWSGVVAAVILLVVFASNVPAQTLTAP